MRRGQNDLLIGLVIALVVTLIGYPLGVTSLSTFIAGLAGAWGSALWKYE